MVNPHTTPQTPATSSYNWTDWCRIMSLMEDEEQSDGDSEEDEDSDNDDHLVACHHNPLTKVTSFFVHFGSYPFFTHIFLARYSKL